MVGQEPEAKGCPEKQGVGDGVVGTLPRGQVLKVQQAACRMGPSVLLTKMGNLVSLEAVKIVKTRCAEVVMVYGKPQCLRGARVFSRTLKARALVLTDEGDPVEHLKAALCLEGPQEVDSTPV